MNLADLAGPVTPWRPKAGRQARWFNVVNISKLAFNDPPVRNRLLKSCAPDDCLKDTVRVLKFEVVQTNAQEVVVHVEGVGVRRGLR